MPAYRRYALFYAPPKDSQLARFGAAWLGWDAETGSPSPHPSLPGLRPPVADLTATPRRYGLHGTLRAPFRLAAATSFDALSETAERIARRHAPFDLPPLAVTRLGPFLALCPVGASQALCDLAAACVRETNALRAPLSEADLARRRKAALTPAQDALMCQWGYPYVMEEFRFHLTLTGPLAPDICPHVQEALTRHLAPMLATPEPVRELTLFGEAEEGRFHIVTRYALGA